MGKNISKNRGQPGNKSSLKTLIVPQSTYRVQFSPRFRVPHALKIIPYLKILGISHLYASPLFKARPGSQHGYDVVDPRAFNPQLGNSGEFQELFRVLKKQKLSLLMDFVSNHMAADPRNPWWQDVKKRGKASPFASIFDIRWGEGREIHSYRRFFDIGELVGVRLEDPAVFDQVHRFLFRLIRLGKIQGLRIDHIDGLWDPKGYLNYLRKKSGKKIYTVVEKILSGGETLPSDWEAEGNTGYDFLNEVNGWLVDPKGYRKVLGHYGKVTGIRQRLSQIVFQQKKRMAFELFKPELEALSEHLGGLGEKIFGRKLEMAQVNQALATTAAALPVYRTYLDRGALRPQDRVVNRQALNQAKKGLPKVRREVWDLLEKLLLGKISKRQHPKTRSSCRSWVGRWQQFTGPVMAKGVEDTVFYQYFPLISLNEVGGDHRIFSNRDFHRAQEIRARQWPHSLKATSTHDTKRSEDVRSRINVLGEVPDPWRLHLEKWIKLNKRLKQSVHEVQVPSLNEEIFLYQTLLGAWPLSKSELPSFKKRMEGYLIKALREAKTHSHWVGPDETYERAMVVFFQKLISKKNQKFMSDFLAFQKKIAFYGFLNSLSQLLLKLSTPGIPDFYQGTEIWDLSLVDPDNRRPVDFTQRKKMLQQIQGSERNGRRELLSLALKKWQDGRIKLFMTHIGLMFRQNYSLVFQMGTYRPLRVSGGKKDSVLSFLRCHRKQWVWVVVPRFWTQHFPQQENDFGKEKPWEGSYLHLPAGVPKDWQEAFGAKNYSFHEREKKIPLERLLGEFPFALLGN